MKVYAIRDWNRLFENNRSRTVEDLRWVAIPNRHDGENYSTLITHKDGAEMFAAWVLIVQVASRCHPRGTLLRGGKIPHDPASLSLKTRAPEKWFEKMFSFLEKNSDWLIVTDVAGDCQETVRQVTADCQAGDEGGREGKKEWNGKNIGVPPDDFFPENLRTAEFKNAWSEWKEDRRLRKKPLTERAEKLGLAKCSKWGEAKSIQLIDLAIERGWQGLYEPAYAAAFGPDDGKRDETGMRPGIDYQP